MLSHELHSAVKTLVAHVKMKAGAWRYVGCEPVEQLLLAENKLVQRCNEVVVARPLEHALASWTHGHDGVISIALHHCSGLFYI
jgi:hypothetical protein